jgi:ABC-2 type transport system permease protein
VSPRRLRALVRRVVAEVRRDRPSLALLFIAPIVITGLLTYILREGDTPHVTVAVVNQGPPPAGILLSGVLRNAGMDVVDAADETAAREAVRAKDASLAIVIPADVTSGSGAIRVITLGLDPLADAGDLGALRDALTSALGQASGTPIPQFERVTIYGTGSDDPMVPFAPAIVAFFLYFFVYLLTGVSFLRERTGGTLERLMATPVTRGEVVGGYLLGFGLFATVQVAILLTWALGSLHVPSIGPLPAFSLGLGIPVAGSPAIAFLVVVLLGLGAISLGIFLSTFARTELQVIQFIPVVLVPQFLLSGVLFPVDSLPSVLQPLVAFMPLHYAVDALRLVFIQGADLATQALAVDVAVLALIAVLFAVVASLTIRRDVV